ncbi:MAG: helicase-related protein [Dethiobacteria bacterium]
MLFYILLARQESCIYYLYKTKFLPAHPLRICLMTEIDHLKKLDVLPYRAGFEEEDRKIVQSRLTSGNLRGIISTSALELGVDIPHLDVGVLVGVPRSIITLPFHTVKIKIPVDNLIPIPGESKLGWYDLETGEISES